MTDDIRKAFEACTKVYYEDGSELSEFHKNSDGQYAYPQQQDDFTMFCSGFQAGRADERKRVMEMLGSEEMMEEAIKAIRKADDDESLPTYSDFAKAALSAIRKALDDSI